MRKNLRWKAVLIAAVAGICIWSAYPPAEKIKLGLDLQGGIHVIMKVNMDDAFNADTNRLPSSMAEPAALGEICDNATPATMPTTICSTRLPDMILLRMLLESMLSLYSTDRRVG